MIYNHLDEELIIDYALGKVTEEKKKQVTTHLQTCPQCQRLLKSWEEIFQTEVKEIPSEKIKEKLDQHIHQTNKKKVPIPFILAIGSAALIFFLFQWLNFQEEPLQTPTIVQVDEHTNIRMVDDPLTRQYPIIPIGDFQQVNGKIWVNYLTDELFVEIFQLPVMTNHDYQLWIIYHNNKFTGELMTTKNGVSRIHLKGGNIQQLKRIKASLEPLGGSPKPTGPEPFIIELPLE